MRINDPNNVIFCAFSATFKCRAVFVSLMTNQQLLERTRTSLVVTEINRLKNIRIFTVTSHVNRRITRDKLTDGLIRGLGRLV